jgi:hypothetical protein
LDAIGGGGVPSPIIRVPVYRVVVAAVVVKTGFSGEVNPVAVAGKGAADILRDYFTGADIADRYML